MDVLSLLLALHGGIQHSETPKLEGYSVPGTGVRFEGNAGLAYNHFEVSAAFGYQRHSHTNDVNTRSVETQLDPGLRIAIRYAIFAAGATIAAEHRTDCDVYVSGPDICRRHVWVMGADLFVEVRAFDVGPVALGALMTYHTEATFHPMESYSLQLAVTYRRPLTR